MDSEPGRLDRQPPRALPRRRRKTPVAYPRDRATAERVSAVADQIRGRHGLAAAADRWKPHAVGLAHLRRGTTVLALDDYSEIPSVQSVVGAS
jgi:hypothetical protein